MPHKNPTNWTFEVFVPEPVTTPDDEIPAGPGSTLHSKGLLTGLLGSEEKAVEFNNVRSQWTQTIEGIVGAVSEWSETSAGKWKIDEVSFGLTLSAEGKLLFIAKAGAQASVQVKVKRA